VPSRAALSASLVCLLALAACGQAAPSQTSPAPTTGSTAPATTGSTAPATTDPTVPTTTGSTAPATTSGDAAPARIASGEAITDDALVLFEGRWLCEVQRRSFADLSDMETLRTELLASAGLDRSAYDSFQADLAEDQDRRRLVLAVFETVCA
jgi:ABC-type transport system substrate-binding protein